MQNLKFQGDGTSIPAAENLIIPPFMSALSDKVRKENEMSLGPYNVEPISKHSAQVNPFSGFFSEPMPFLNIRSFSEPGLICGLEKDKSSKPQSKSGCTTTKLKPKTKFLSRFGRANGEGSRGFRKCLSHINDRLSSAGTLLQVCSLPPLLIAGRDDDDSISSICLEYVDSMAKLPSSESKFVDEISSNEEMKNTYAFANEEGIFHGIFAIPDEPCGVNGYVEGYFPTSPEVLYYSRKRRKCRGYGRKEGLPKSLLHKMDISLMPLKKNLAHRRHGKPCISNDDTGPKDTGKSKEKKMDYISH